MKAFISGFGMITLCVVCAISCTRDNSGPDIPDLPADTSCKVSSIVFKYAPYFDLETRMQYDVRGRVIKVTDYDSSRPRWSASFEYVGDKVIEIDSAASSGSDVIDMQSIIIHHELGANGFATASYFYNYAPVRDTTFYTYDADGYQTKMVRKHYAFTPPNTQRLEYVYTYDYIISGGNRVKEILNGKPHVDYEYYSNLSKFGGFNLTNYYDYPFLGRKNTSLVKVLSSYNPNNGEAEGSSNYEYQLDAEGKPLVVRHSNGSGSDSLVLSYKCK